MLVSQLCLYSALTSLPLHSEFMDERRNAAICLAASQMNLKGWIDLRVTMTRERGRAVLVVFCDQRQRESKVLLDIVASKLMEPARDVIERDLPEILRAAMTVDSLPPWFDVAWNGDYYSIDRSPDILGWDPPINITKSRQGFVVKR